MEVAINKCFGGFSLSQEACKRLIKLGINFYKEDEKPDYKNPYIQEISKKLYYIDGQNLELSRTNPLLIKVIKQMGQKSWGECSKLKVVNLNIVPEIKSFDGIESVSVNVYED